jgi:uncharacterized protein (DUF433 family)
MTQHHPKGTVIVDRKLGIVRNPGISCGRACIDGRWIGCVFIVGRWNAGESKRDLADDYGITLRDVNNAIQYIEKRRGTKDATAHS